MPTGFDRGHKIFYDGENWRYCYNSEIATMDRPCIKCNRPPNYDGTDACLGHIDGAISACCGHGVYDGWITYE
jgi:hypothetical protein